MNEALAELYDLHRMRRRLSLAETVRRVVERTRLVEFALTQRDGEQGAANLLAIVDQARLFAAAGGGGLRPFIRHLRDSMEQEEIEIEATVAEETDDVVRIMTMHGAKGLEYPIVALANLGGTGGTQRAAGAARARVVPALPRRAPASPAAAATSPRRATTRCGRQRSATSRPSGCGCCTSRRRERASTCSCRAWSDGPRRRGLLAALVQRASRRPRAR